MPSLPIYIGQVAFAHALVAKIQSDTPTSRLYKTRYRRSKTAQSLLGCLLRQCIFRKRDAYPPDRHISTTA